MSRLASNSFANLAGQLLQPALSILLVPFFIHFLGVEAFGLIVFFTMLVTVLGIFTKSIASSLQREIALRNSASPGEALGRLVHTFELAYLSLGILVGAILAIVLPIFSDGWLQAELLPDETIDRCAITVAFRIAVAFPTSVYQAVFIGTERQVRGNLIYAGYVLTSTALGVMAIYLFKSIVAFYILDLLAAICSLLVFRRQAHCIVGPTVRTTRFDWTELKRLLSFSTGIIWTNSVGVLVTQFDRIAITRILNLWSLAIYGTATASGQVVSLVTGAYLTAAYPQLCQEASHEDRSGLAALIVRNARVVALLAAVLSMPLVFFSQEILLAWTMKPNVAADAKDVMQIYVAGSVMLALASTLYQAQTALGISRYGVYFNAAALLWFPATAWILVVRLGTLGAATAWCAYCAASWLFNLFTVFRIVFNVRQLLSYLTSVATIAVTTVAIGMGARLVVDVLIADLYLKLVIAAVGTLALLAICSKLTNLQLWKALKTLKAR